MMAKFLFCLLLGLSVMFMLNSLRRREGVLQFPALFAGAFVFSIVPQLVNHVFYPGHLPLRVYQDLGVESGLLMCILCLVAGIAGYRGEPMAAGRLERTVPEIDVERLFWAGVVLCLVGIWGAAKLAALAGGWKEQFLEGGHYALEWSGAPVIWVYVAKLLPLGLILCLNSTLVRGCSWKWALTLLMMLYPLAVIVFLGRREMTFDLTLILLTSLWFHRRWAPPQWLSLSVMALGGMFIVLVPYYRSYVNETGNIKGAIAQVDVRAAIEAYATGERAEGMDNLIIGIPARQAYPSFFWGTGFWNKIVAYWVPGQIVGYGLKQRLMVEVGNEDDDVFSRYCGLTCQYGSYPTGPYSAFCEFWFPGCLLYFVMGRFYRGLWHLAENRQHLGAQLICVSCALLIPMAVVRSIQAAFATCLLPVGVLVSVLWLTRDRYPVLVSSELQ